MGITVFQAVVLGAIQGLAEFLPISSSAHLILAPWLLGWPDQGLTFDVALHLGTAIALLGYFSRDWLRLAQALFAGLASAEARKDPAWKLAWMLALGSVPAALVGLAFEDLIGRELRNPVVIAVVLMLFGVALYVVDRLASKTRPIEDAGFSDSLMVGCAQALALLPGVSRSGVTLTAGLLLGLERAAAARFSFLLSAPIVFAAVVYELRVLVEAPPTSSESLAFVAGMATAALVGALAIGFLLRYLQNHSTALFMWYRVAAGGVILVVAYSRA